MGTQGEGKERGTRHNGATQRGMSGYKAGRAGMLRLGFKVAAVPSTQGTQGGSILGVSLGRLLQSNGQAGKVCTHQTHTMLLFVVLGGVRSGSTTGVQGSVWAAQGRTRFLGTRLQLTPTAINNKKHIPSPNWVRYKREGNKVGACQVPKAINNVCLAKGVPKI